MVSSLESVAVYSSSRRGNSTAVTVAVGRESPDEEGSSQEIRSERRRLFQRGVRSNRPRASSESMVSWVYSSGKANKCSSREGPEQRNRRP